ncbi:ABC-2 transporter permease [Fluviispira multicolorata]|uniref:ABC-2 type transport system permease protein n=1 Tax=Fluviispira multicolorata TaxID=2654512 RepID=A0A833N2I5_9BACT|nr:hypothetical protein [Fluviispira multicolorata]KAB8032242.1 hypothetical protein GCL57_06230 [Fluviispira multicolorata]
MRLGLEYFKIYFLSTIRNIPALFFTLIFPPLMLLLFAHQWEEKNAFGALIVFFNYSVQTVALMLLGMGVTQEKNSEWAKYLRSLPVGLKPMLIGRMLHTLSLSFINLFSVSLVALFILHINVNFEQIISFATIALLGAIPMALLGMAIGYAANPESSRSIFTLLNLLLFFGSFSLPATGIFGTVRNFIPTYQWTVLSYSFVDKSISILNPLICLAAYSFFFLFLFQKMYRKTQKV